MKPLLLALLVAAPAAARAELPCVLTPADLQALAQSPSHLDADSAEALPPKKQKLLCETRAFMKLVDRLGRIDDMGIYSQHYLSPAEYARMEKASNDFIERTLRSKGLGRRA